MRYSTQVKPISYLKANAAEVLDKLSKDRQPLIITQNGEAKAVMQDLATYENTQETLALLKILALGQQQIAEGKFDSADNVFKRLQAKQKARALAINESAPSSVVSATVAARKASAKTVKKSRPKLPVNRNGSAASKARNR